MKKLCYLFSVLCFSLTFVFANLSHACTGIIVKTSENFRIPARTMEFGFDINSKIIVVPAGTKIESLSSNPDKTGLVYNAKYGFVGMNGVDKPFIADGLNEAGLYFGAFYFNGYAEYEELTEANQKKAVSSEEFGNWILANFASVNEVKKNLDKISVVGTYIEIIDSFAPFHYAVTDKAGQSIVIEHTKDGVKIYDNKVNVITNNPTYDWHLMNLNNYVSLTSVNSQNKKINDDFELSPFGEGSGLFGLPGDHSPTSRFVRAAAFANSSLTPKSLKEGVFSAFHILNTFDIPKGSIKSSGDHESLTDYTVWTSVADTQNNNYYFKTYKNQDIKMINVSEALQAAGSKVKIIETETPQIYQNVSTDFKN